LVGSGLVIAAATPTDEPAWAAAAPELTVFASNVLKSNPDPVAALEVAVRSDADVIVFSELSPEFEPALQRSGLLERYPTAVRAGKGNVLLTRLPVVDEGVARHEGMDMPTATVRVDDRDVLVIGVHTLAPHAVDSVGEWTRGYEGVAQAAASGSDVVAIGDFNGGPWNGPFRRLLDWGFVDAHAELGHGLSRTWGPRQFGLDGAVRLLGIDHAVSRGDLAPVAVRDVDVPGSDHQAVAVTYAVR
jgi:endonuclease/exonuclease/phosphatase (EEP) superfamily protein YafD